MFEEFWLFWFIFLIVVAVIFGIISRKINEDKGYYGGFAWGFFLGIIGIIVVACRSDNRNRYSYHDDVLSKVAIETESARILREGGWKCGQCNTVNPNHLTTCTCGRRKIDNDKPVVNKMDASELNNADVIFKYKKMLDEGVITQEEFDTKKKQLLNL